MSGRRVSILRIFTAWLFCVLGTAGCGGHIPAAPSSTINMQSSNGAAPIQYIIHVLPLFEYPGGDKGTQPVAVLAANPAGSLFGVTSGGGQFGYGTVYELLPPSPPDKEYHEVVLHAFDNSDGASPAAPPAPLALMGGTLFGTTKSGGAYGLGTVYEITTGGNFQVLYSFKGGPTDGAVPESLLNVDSAGNLFGTTIQGGAPGCSKSGGCCSGGCGTIYELSPNPNGTGYSESILYQFKGGSDGSYPWGGMTAAGNDFYGTTYFGGSDECYGTFSGASTVGCGTVYKLSAVPGGAYSETVIHRFLNTDGKGTHPHSGLYDIGGTLYGTTVNGGAGSCAGGCGTAYGVTPDGHFSILHAFQGRKDGALPYVSLAYNNGYLYGTTLYGGGSNQCGRTFAGVKGCGVIFRVKPGQPNTYEHFYSFNTPKNGQNPFGAVFDNPITNQIYGTTSNGGKYGFGALFRLQ